MELTIFACIRIAQEENEELDEEMLKERESGIMELGNKSVCTLFLGFLSITMPAAQRI